MKICALSLSVQFIFMPERQRASQTGARTSLCVSIRL